MSTPSCGGTVMRLQFCGTQYVKNCRHCRPSRQEWWRPWNALVSSSDASLSGYGVCQAWWPLSEVKKAGRMSERARFRRAGAHSARLALSIERTVVGNVPTALSNSCERQDGKLIRAFRRYRLVAFTEGTGAPSCGDGGALRRRSWYSRRARLSRG